MAAKPFHTRNDLPAESRAKVIDLLNQNLTDLTDLYTQTKHAHWNVKGPTFYQAHLLLDELAETVEDLADEVAERATALGGVAHGGAKHVAARSRLPEFPRDVFDAQAVIAAAADRYGAVASVLRGAERIDKERGVYLGQLKVTLADGRRQPVMLYRIAPAPKAPPVLRFKIGGFQYEAGPVDRLLKVLADCEAKAKAG